MARRHPAAPSRAPPRPGTRAGGAAVGAAAILVLAPPAGSSGFHPAMAYFGSVYRPDPPLDRFAAERRLFAELRERAMALGFRHVESGPLVRSSYHAWEHVN